MKASLKAWESEWVVRNVHNRHTFCPDKDKAICAFGTSQVYLRSHGGGAFGLATNDDVYFLFYFYVFCFLLVGSPPLIRHGRPRKKVAYYPHVIFCII